MALSPSKNRKGINMYSDTPLPPYTYNVFLIAARTKIERYGEPWEDVLEEYKKVMTEEQWRECFLTLQEEGYIPTDVDIEDYV